MSAGDYKSKLMDIVKSANLEDLNDQASAVYSSNLATTSKEVQRRVRALKKYQLESIQLESNFFERVHQLEAEFLPAFSAVHQKRKAVVTGAHEPAEGECEMPLIHGLADEDLKKLEADAPVEGTPSKGIPDFWFHVLNNSVGEYIQELDAPILKYLEDLTVEYHVNPIGYSLLFHFAENPYFNNTVLKKSYELKLTPDEEDPFDYEGPTPIKCQGTQIEWKEGQNVIAKVKMQLKGEDGDVPGGSRSLSKSFFNFFDPALLDITADDETIDEEDMDAHFELGQFLRDQVYNRAVLFFTGEADDYDDEYDDYSDEDESSSEDEEMQEG